MNNAQSYAFTPHSKYLFESDDEEEWEFRGTEIVRTEKSMSVAVQKNPNQKKHMKKSNSFLSGPSKEQPKKKTQHTKKCLNSSEVGRKPASHSKSSMNKTSFSSGGLSKSSLKEKKRSVSRDFLILDNTIYECENIEDINEKIICGGSSIFDHQRFCKMTMKKISTLEKYLTGFSSFSGFSHQLPTPMNIKVNDKAKLYALLKGDFPKKVRNKKTEIDQLVKFAAEKVENDASLFLNKKPECQKDIREWKNEKLHQLLTAHTLLQGSEDNLEDFDEHHRFSQEESEQISIEIKNESKEKEKFCRYIQERYPQQIAQKVQPSESPELPLSHRLSLAGVQSFMGRFWDYLLKTGEIEDLIQNLRKQYGLSESDKKQFLRQGIPNVPYSFIAGANLLKDDTFIEFCKEENQTIDGPRQQVQTQILWEKAVFDCTNEVLCEYQPQFPTGCLHPLEGNPCISAFLIDEGNISDVWSDVMDKVFSISQACQDPLKDSEGKRNWNVYTSEVRDSFQKLGLRGVYQELSEGIFLDLLEELALEKLMK